MMKNGMAIERLRSMVSRLFLVLLLVSTSYGNKEENDSPKRLCTPTDVSLYEHEGVVKCHPSDSHCWELGLVSPFFKKYYNLKNQTVMCWLTGAVAQLNCYADRHLSMSIEYNRTGSLHRPFCYQDPKMLVGIEKVYLPIGGDARNYFVGMKMEEVLEYSCLPDYTPRTRYILPSDGQDLTRAFCDRIGSPATTTSFRWTWRKNVYACLYNNGTVSGYRRTSSSNDTSTFCVNSLDGNAVVDFVGYDNRIVVYDLSGADTNHCAQYLRTEAGDNAQLYVVGTYLVEPCMNEWTDEHGEMATIPGEDWYERSRFKYMDCSTGDWDRTCPCECAGDLSDRVFGEHPVYHANGETCSIFYLCPNQHIDRTHAPAQSVEKGVKMCYSADNSVVEVVSCEEDADAFCRLVPDVVQADGGYWDPKRMRWTCPPGHTNDPYGEVRCNETSRQWSYPSCQGPSCFDTVPNYATEVDQNPNTGGLTAKVNATALCGNSHSMTAVTEIGCVNGRWGPELTPSRDCCSQNASESNGNTDSSNDNTPPFFDSCGKRKTLFGTPIRNTSGCVVGCEDHPMFHPAPEVDPCGSEARCVVNVTHFNSICAPPNLCEIIEYRIGLEYRVKVVIGWRFDIPSTPWNESATEYDPRVWYLMINNGTTRLAFASHWYIMLRRLKREDGRWLYWTTPACYDTPWWNDNPRIPRLADTLPEAVGVSCGEDGGVAYPVPGTGGRFFRVKRVIKCDLGDDNVIETTIPCDGWAHLKLMNTVVDISGHETTTALPTACSLYIKKISQLFCTSTATTPQSCPPCGGISCRVCPTGDPGGDRSTTSTPTSSSFEPTTTTTAAVLSELSQTLQNTLPTRCNTCQSSCRPGMTMIDRKNQCQEKYQGIQQKTCWDAIEKFCAEADCTPCF